MIKRKVLFICVHNSARSQMSEELLRKQAGELFEIESAGLEPGKLNPYVIKILKEEGIDISGKETKSAFDLLKEGKRFHYVITVCDETAAEKCPVFPGSLERLHWGFPDPSGFRGTDQEILEKIRELKEQIKIKINDFVKSVPVPANDGQNIVS